MHKVLLVIDEFTELEAMESLMKRLGFDVMAIGKELLVPDALLRFQPDLVMATFKGRSVDGPRLAAKFKAVKAGTPAPRVVLIWSSSMPSPQLTPEVEGAIDALVEAPLHPVGVIRVLARLLNVAEEPLIKKFERIGATFRWPEPKSVQKEDWDPVKKPGQAATIVTDRSARYREFLRTHDEPVDNVLPREKTYGEIRKLRASESTEEKDDINRINAEKRAFAETLFKSTKSDDKSQKN